MDVVPTESNALGDYIAVGTGSMKSDGYKNSAIWLAFSDCTWRFTEKNDKFKALKYSLIHGQERASTMSLKQFLCSYRADAAKNKIPHLIMGLQNYKINWINSHDSSVT